MLFIPHRLQAYFLKITSGWWPPFTSMHCWKRAWKLPYTRLRRSSSIAATSLTILNCRLKTLHFRHRHRFVITTNTGNTLLHVPTLHCDWPYEMASSPLPFPFAPTKTSYRAGAIFKFEMSVGSAPPCTINIKYDIISHVKHYFVFKIYCYMFQPLYMAMFGIMWFRALTYS